MLRHLLALLLVTASAGAARAQASIDLNAPAAITPQAAFNVSLAYTLEGGTYEDLTLSFELPAEFRLNSATVPNTFTGNCAANTIGPATCNFVASSLDVTGQGVSGAITLSLLTRRFALADGTPITFAASASGIHTPPSGTPAPLGIATAEASSVIAGEAVAQFHNLDFPVQLQTRYWGVGPSGETGLFFEYRVRPRNGGTTPFEADASLSVQLGAGVEYVGVYSAQSNNAVPTTGGPNWVVADPPAVGATGATIVAVSPEPNLPRSNWNVNDHYYYPHVHITAFIPCSAIPTGLNNPDFALTAVFDAVEPIHGGDPIAHTTSGGIANPPADATSGVGCGEGFLLTKSSQFDQYGAGSPAPVRYRVQATPPKGVIPVDDAILVDTLPPGHGGVTVENLTASGFEAYACDLPPATVIDAASFVIDLQGDECQPFPGPDAPVLQTHLVFWNAEWGGGQETQTTFDAFVYVSVPIDYLGEDPGPLPFTNHVSFDGHGLGTDPNTGAPTTVGFTGEASRSVNVYYAARLGFSVFGNASQTTAPPILSPGEAGVISFRAALNSAWTPGLNPSVEVSIPSDVTLDAVEILAPAATCDAPPPAPSANSLDGQVLTLAWGTETEPYLMSRNDCISFRLQFTLNSNTALLDQDTFTFTSLAYADNMDPSLTEAQRTNSYTFTAAVPPELRSEATAECDDTLQPLFRANAINSGGVDLTDVVLTFFMPRDGVGGATGDATFVGVGDVSPGATVEYQRGDDTWHADLPADLAEVKAVRATFPSLPAGGSPVGFSVSATAADPTHLLPPRATASSTILGAADSGYGSPYVGTNCIGAVFAGVFWDPAASAEFTGAEPLLDGWSLAIFRGSDVDPTATLTSSDGGAVLAVLVPGDYTLVATPPETAGVTWTSSTPGFSTAFTVIGGQDSFAYLGATCDCADLNPDDCQIPTCQPDASCIDVAADDGATCEDENLCTTNDTCLDGVCDSGPPPDCDDGNVCTDGACDPESGECVQSANSAPCDDGDACTTFDTCAAGACVGTEPLVCTSDNACEIPRCDAALGCVTDPADAGTPCDDELYCTSIDTCDGAGGCTGATSPCDAFCDEVGDRCIDCLTPADCTTPGDLCLESGCDDGACVVLPKDIVCDDADSCQESGYCDPLTGACAYDARECTPTPILLTVTDSGGAVVGTVRCEVNGTVITCDMRDEGGQQVLDVRPGGPSCGG